VGADIVDEMRVLFVDQNGPDLRNAIAHGTIEYASFYNFVGIYAWWFIFYLAINPVYRRFGNVAGQERDGPGS